MTLAHSLVRPPRPRPRWVAVASVLDFPRRSARTLRQGAQVIAVFRSASGSFFALEDRCPHRGGPLSEGIIHGKRVTCPLHGWVLELTSGEATGPDVGCARRFPVKVEDGVVHVQVTGSPQ